MCCGGKVKLLSVLKILSTDDGTKEVVEGLVAFYWFLILFRKVTIFLNVFLENGSKTKE